MSAEALLANPRMFDSGHEKTVDSCAVALEYLALASLPELAPPPPVEWARAHLVAILRRALTLHPGPAAALDNASSLEELREAVQQARNYILAAITAGATYAQADLTAVKNGLASVSAKVNTILTLLRNLNA
jgi:hypothetical protein